MSALRLSYTSYHDPENFNEGLILPPELLEQVFLNLDAPTFCKSRSVCRSWNNIIKPIQNKKSIWRTFCINEIAENVLEEILGFKSIKSSDFDWMDIYKKWFSSRMIISSPNWTKKILAYYENPVTTIQISGSWIITGHCNGYVNIWNMFTAELCRGCMCHLMIIVDMALVDLLNLGSYYGDEELPWAHHHVITISRDSYIHVLSLLETKASTDSDISFNLNPEDLSQVRVFNDMFAVSSRDNTVTLFQMKLEMKPYFHLDVTQLKKIAGPRDYILSLGLWHNRVQCISHGSKLREYQPEDEEWTTEAPIPLDYARERPYASIRPSAAFLCRKNISFLLSDNDGKIIISIGDGMMTQCYLRQKLGTDIVTLAFHGTILALGGKNGKLFLYYIPHEEYLLYRDYTIPDCTLSLSEFAIITIDISLQQDAPVVVAYSLDSIHVVKWYGKEKNLPRRVVQMEGDKLEKIVQRL